MRKKLYFLAIAVIGVSFVANAQAQNPECMTNLSIFSEHVKVKNYDAAYIPWKMVYENCPALHYATYVYGERILKDKIEKSTGADQDKYINELLGVYDNSIKYFPTKTNIADVAIDKTLLEYDNKKVNDQQVYDALDKAYKEDAKDFDNPKALYLYFSSLVNLYNDGSKDLESVFDTYDEVTNKIDEENNKYTAVVTALLPKEDAGTLTAKEKQELKIATNYSENYGKIQESIDSKLGALADCENLIPLYKKNFDEKKNDVSWVKRAVGRMFSKDCTDDPLFKQLFEAQLALDPSASAYMYGGSLKVKAGDANGAVADFNKAVDLETDAKKKSNILYKIATIYSKSSKSTSRSYAQKAIDADGANGKAYLLIAHLIASSANDCGTSAFEKRAVYWKAAEMARKAGRVDPALNSRASQAALSYNAKAPSKTDIFNSGMAGKTITFKCWVGGSVEVPNL